MTVSTVQLVLGITIVLGGGLFLLVASTVAYLLWRAYQKLLMAMGSLGSKAGDITHNLEVYSDSLSAMHQKEVAASVALADLPKYVAGHSKVAVTLAGEVERLRRAVEAFASVVVKRDPRLPNLIVPKEYDMGREDIIESLLAASPGLSREEAEDRVDSNAEDEKRMALSME